MNAFIVEGKANCYRIHTFKEYDQAVELKDRILAVRNYANLNQSELAKACGVKPSAINHQESGVARSISGDLLILIARATRTRAEWIYDGEGEMTDAQSQAKLSATDPVVAHLAALPENLAMALRKDIEARYYKALYEAEESAEEKKSKRLRRGAGPKDRRSA